MGKKKRKRSGLTNKYSLTRINLNDLTKGIPEEGKMKKIISCRKEIFVIFLCICAGVIYFISLKRPNFIPVGPMKVVLVFFFLAVCFLPQKNKFKERWRGVVINTCKVLLSGFSGFMLSEISAREINKKLDIGIDWQLTNAEILILEKGVLDDVLKSCWDKTNDGIYANANYIEGNACYDAGQYQKSNEKYLLAMDDAKDLSDDNVDKSMYIANIYLRLGFNYEKLGDKYKKETIEAFRDSIDESECYFNRHRKEILERKLTFRGWIAAYLMLTKIYAKDNRFPEASEILVMAKNIWKEEFYYLKEIWYHKIYVDLLKGIDGLHPKIKKSFLSTTAL